jgi:isocitrate lyase
MSPQGPTENNVPKANVSSLLSTDPQRRQGVPYAQEDVECLRGSFRIEYTVAREGAKRLWSLLKTEPPHYRVSEPAISTMSLT